MSSATTPQASPNAAASGSKNAFWGRVIAIVSVVICGAVALLALGPRPAAGSLDVSFLPTFNASLNATTGVLLVVGWRMARQKRVLAHRRLMLSAFATSTAFLVSYVIYHSFKIAPKAYLGPAKPVYLIILLTHIVLAAVIVPLALTTGYFGFSGQVARHRRIAKWTMPIWLYVSATGVLIYAALYLLPA